MAAFVAKIVPCLNCGLRFQVADWLPWRVRGFCEAKCDRELAKEHAKFVLHPLPLSVIDECVARTESAGLVPHPAARQLSVWD